MLNETRKREQHISFALLLFFADRPVGGDGGQGIRQLGQGDGQQVEFFGGHGSGNAVGQSGDGGGQFAGVHVGHLQL